MAFENLPRQAQMGAVAEAYAAEILAGSRAVAMNSRVLLDVPYGDDYWQRIDIYLPAQDRLHDLPVLLFLHGGGWSNGYKEWISGIPPFIRPVQKRLQKEVDLAAFGRTAASAGPATRRAWLAVDRRAGSPDGRPNERAAGSC
jgi:hypothetical protein